MLRTLIDRLFGGRPPRIRYESDPVLLAAYDRGMSARDDPDPFPPCPFERDTAERRAWVEGLLGDGGPAWGIAQAYD